MLILGPLAPAQTESPAKPDSNSSRPPATQLGKEPPPAIPPGILGRGEWNATFITQEFHGSFRRLTGHPAEIEDGRLLFRADEIDYDESTGELHARGHVYYRHFERNDAIHASRVDYNTEEETGRFYDVVGETHPKIVKRPGVLSVDSPLHFEGEWAERVGGKYILYQGWVTNCKIPKPWWQLKGPKFEIVPNERATATNSRFLLHGIPLFYTPYFYHSLEKEPRKSGFLIPNIVPHTQRGFMVGVGYYWAISRSYDATYRFQDFTSNAFSHHVDFRGRPREGTEFNAILYGVQDRGKPGTGEPPPTYSGLNLYLIGKSDLGGGWAARGYSNYISSFRFRQQWSESYNEAIQSEIRSVGIVGKDWSTYSFDFLMARLENFESSEVPFTDPKTMKTDFIANAVTIRKVPEAQLAGRDRRLFRGLPLWLSFESTAGLLFRSQPIFEQGEVIDRFQTGNFTSRVRLAPHLTTAVHLGPLHLVPSIGVEETYYGEAQAREPFNPALYNVVGTNIVRSARDFSLDLIFPSLARVFQKKTVFGDKLKHVIEPRATYRYVTGIGKDFDRFIRFDEYDLMADTNELRLSLANRVFAKRGDSVEEIFSWEVLQKRYFDPTFGGALLTGQRNIFSATADLTAYAFIVGPRSSSPVVSLLRASPISGLGIQWQADYDQRFHRLANSMFTADYRWKKYFVAAGNNQVHADPALTTAANQFNFRVGFGDANHRGWSAASDAVYDYRKAAIQYSTSQVTYNTDCCGISVQYRHSSVGQRDQLRIAFSVANIGTVGNLRKQDRIF